MTDFGKTIKALNTIVFNQAQKKFNLPIFYPW